VRVLDRVVHVGKAQRLHADHPDPGLEALGRGRHAADQAAPAHRHDQGLELRHRLQHLQGHGALAGDDGRVVVGVDQRQLLALRQFHGVGAGFLQGVAMQHHLGAEQARAFHLHHGREARHDDHGPQAQPLRVVGHALGVVAGAHGDHAALALFVC
jgi:hypothetical protein